ncbi:SUN domain-containing protein 2-like [Crotalus tigris]|uniref:SUN domain-containing protein 2-like n=1 Tax=Crotalus tigris TaxID=88082 RepID=UPI00192F2723|nr:SUN domain-containing protein 2-like [Crotalus tigris]
MQRRSERLAILQKLRPISYRETGVKRVFKKIRRKRRSFVLHEEPEKKTWQEAWSQGSWDTKSCRSEDPSQPCCSKDLLDQSSFIIQHCFEAPRLVEPIANITVYQVQQSLILEKHWRLFVKVLTCILLIFILGIFGGFISALCTSSDVFKQFMKMQLSRQNEALQQHLQKQIGSFRQKVAGLQTLVDALENIHGHWKTQKHIFEQGGSTQNESSHFGKKDYALSSEGAHVVKFSNSFNTRAQVCMLGFCWDYMRSPNMILERDNTPGNCWAMKGSQGYVVIKLSQAVRLTSVALDHISKTVSHTEEITSAPQNFSVYGFKNDFEKEEGQFLGSFVYRVDRFPLQTFKLEGAPLDKFNYILLKILTNWHHPNYTCIYGFRVYGE